MTIIRNNHTGKVPPNEPGVKESGGMM